MPAYVPDNFDIGTDAPADSRVVKATIAARDAIPVGVRFEGLAVYVQAETKTYQLQGGTSDTDWVELTSGGGSFGGNLEDINDVVVTDLTTDEQLIFNETSGTWNNLPEAFIVDKVSGIARTNSVLTKVRYDVPIYSTDGTIIFDDAGTLTTITSSATGFDISNAVLGTVISQGPNGEVSLGGASDPNAKLKVELGVAEAQSWAAIFDAGATKDGVQINVYDHTANALQIVTENDGLLLDVTGSNTQLRSTNLMLGFGSVPSHGDNDRDFLAEFDNYTFYLGDGNSHTGFLVTDTTTDENIRFNLNDGLATFYAQNGIDQGQTSIQGSLEVVANSNFLAGDPARLGYITAEDYISTDKYFVGDRLFNHNTLELPDATGPNICKVASIGVKEEEYVVVELDYVIPDSAIGMNKGRILLQAGFDPDGQTTQIIYVPVDVVVPTAYTVSYGDVSTIGVINDNGGVLAPFETGDTIIISSFAATELTLQYDGLSGDNLHYLYTVTAPTGIDFAPTVGFVISQTETQIQEVIQVLPGESFVTSLYDIKDKSTGDTGVFWKAVLNDGGSTKTIDLYAQLTIDETFLSYISKYQKEGDPDVEFFDEQTWGSTLPSGTSTIAATLTTGAGSYWALNGTTLYNLTQENVAIGKSIASLHKLEVEGNIGILNSIVIKPSDTASTTTIAAPTESGSLYNVTNSDLGRNIIDVSVDGDVFINNLVNTSREARFNIDGDSGNSYALKVQSSSVSTAAARFAGGGPGVNIAIFDDYLGINAASINGAGILNVANSITINEGDVLNVSAATFEYNGVNVWHDDSTGDLGQLEDVVLTGIAVDHTIKWDGANWITTLLTNGITNLGYTSSAVDGTVTSDTGTDATIPLATIAIAGLMSPTHKDKLDQIADSADVNIQVDWLETTTSNDAYINNKPSNLSDFTDDIGIVDHINDTIIHVTSGDKSNWNSAEANVQSDWDEANTGLASFILNKPTLGTAAGQDYTAVVTDSSADLITSGGIFTELTTNYKIEPATGFTRFGIDTLRLIQGATSISVADVPKLDTDGKVLASQLRSTIGGDTYVFATVAALETEVNTNSLVVPVGDLIHIATSTEPEFGLWLVAVEVSGPGWDFTTAAAADEILDISTGADYYTQTEIDNAFTNNIIVAGAGLVGGGALSYAGGNITVDVNYDSSLAVVGDEIGVDTLFGSPEGVLYTP